MSEQVKLSAPEIWELTKERLAKKLSVPALKMWVFPSELLSINDEEAIIGVVNGQAKTFMTAQYLEAIIETLQEVTGNKLKLKVVVDSSIRQEEDEYVPSIAALAEPDGGDKRQTDFVVPSYSAPVASARISSANLVPKYTFDTFVIGSHNRFLHSAALSVAERPGTSYNPLFIYGGVGLGKTHIMQAIGHHLLKTNSDLVVRYLSCETFTNELINYIRDDRMKEFRKRYRQIDILLVDDIQFIEGKEATQEEFFHTFNALRDTGKQIVLSCDRPPKALAKLEDRLRSRFEWGLIADIQTPDLETRLAILRKKSEMERLSVPDEVLEYIASTYTSNIRELEGALLRLTAYSRMTGSPISTMMVKQILEPSGPPKQKPLITLSQILDAVASEYRVEVSELRSSNRSKHLVLPRHVAMYLAHEMLDMSFPRIGDEFDNRKHTSTLYAYNRIKNSLAEDAALARSLAQISRQLSN